MERIEAFPPPAYQGPQPSAHSLLGSQCFFLPNEVFPFVPQIQVASPPLGDQEEQPQVRQGRVKVTEK